jgi:ArsR family transcriptional regulator
MNLENLDYLEAFYLALADKTRLRLLALMRDEEVCVGSFTEVLGESQPKISRHLAYLRNAGLVSARRDGKWIHYRIAWPDEGEGRRALKAALEWVASRSEPVAADKGHRTGFQDSARRQGRVPTEEQFISEKSTSSYEDNIEETSGAAHNELEEFLL